MRALSVTKQGGVAEVELLGPGKGNAMGPDFWAECPGVFRDLDKDDDVRAVIVRGSGKHFSFGLDLMGMMEQLAPHLMGSPSAKQRTKLLDYIAELQASTNAVAECRKPVIAAVHGYCIGAGLDLIAACDVRLASVDAKFSIREVKLAIVADLGSLHRLPAIIGEGATRDLAFTGRDVDAAEALQMRLVGRVLPDADALLATARAMAADIAKNPPLTVQGIKRVMNQAVAGRVRDGLEHVATWNSAFLASKDLAEAMAAFMEKRAPNFTGE